MNMCIMYIWQQSDKHFCAWKNLLFYVQVSCKIIEKWKTKNVICENRLMHIYEE